MENSCGAWVEEDETVEGGLPPMGVYVLVFPRKGIGVRCFDHDGEDWHWETDGEGFHISVVTHWAFITDP